MTIFLLTAGAPKALAEGMEGDGLKIKDSLVGRRVNPNNPNDVSYFTISVEFSIVLVNCLSGYFVCVQYIIMGTFQLQQMIESDDDEEDPEVKFLKSLTTKQKKKLLK